MTIDHRPSTIDSFPRPCRRLPFYHGDVAGMLAGAEALLEGATASGRPAIRWYVVSERALVLGASQKTPAVDLSACRDAGVAVYQRSAGGATVLVDGNMLGLDVALPHDDPLLARDLTASYRWIGSAWWAALHALGVVADVVDVEQARASGRDTGAAAQLARLACFGGLSPYEVTVDGRKIVGLAQVRRRHGGLFQTALQLRWDAPLMSQLLTVAPSDCVALVKALEERVVGLDGVMARPPACQEIIGAFERALTGHGLEPVDSAWTLAEKAAAERLLNERYQALA